MDLAAISLPRNQRIYWLLRDIGYIEGLGTGIPRIRSILLKEGYPEPIFEQKGPMFKLTVYNRMGSRGPGEALVQRQIAILKTLKVGDIITSKEYANVHKISRPSAVRELNDLCDRGILRKGGSGPSTHYIMIKNVNYLQ